MHREATVPPSGSGSALTLWEFRGDAKQVTGVDDASLDVVDRPQTFADALVPGPNDCRGARYDQLAFRDAGRVFLVRVVSVFPTAEDEQARLRLAADVLDTLRVDPLRAVPVDGPATTTTPKVATGPAYPLPTITTLPPFVPSTDDERAIVAAFEAWADMHTDADLDATVEDPDAVRAPSHEGWAQQTPENLAAYDGRVDSIDLVDADHARVVYTILYNGQPAYPNRVGSAVRVDGTWKVSTETVCGMLRLGNITCPS
jgi:hypothetical protein